MKKVTPIKPLSIEYEELADIANIDNPINSILAEEIQKEIDKEIMDELKKIQYLDYGWHAVETGYLENIDDWMTENVKYRWGMAGKSFYFESKNEATMFALRWVGND